MGHKRLMAGARSLYDVLNVSPEAEPVVIEAAYRALMKRYHPDQAEEGIPVPKDVAAINEAFAILKDPAKRGEYDHRMWSKQQAQRLVELQAMEPRRSSRFFGLTGWILALVLGATVAVMTMARDFAPPVPDSKIKAGAAEALKRIPPERLAAMKAAAAEEVVVHPSADAVIARVRQQVRAPQPVRPATAAQPLRPAAGPVRAERRPPAPRHTSPPKPRKPAEKGDFLEREGYIY